MTPTVPDAIEDESDASPDDFADEPAPDEPLLLSIPEEPTAEEWQDSEPAPDEELPELGDDSLSAADANSWADENDEPDGALGPAVMSWSSRARLPELGIELDAVLDPTLSHSRWTTVEPPEQPTMRTTVRLGAVEATIELSRVEAPVAELRLGRDFLAGRILVRAD